jgi:hypothetical protein
MHFRFEQKILGLAGTVSGDFPTVGFFSSNNPSAPGSRIKAILNSASSLQIYCMFDIRTKYLFHSNGTPHTVYCQCPELEFVKLNPIAVLLVLQNRYSQSCIDI